MAEVSAPTEQAAHQPVKVEGAHLLHRVSFWKRKGFLFLNLSFGTARAGADPVSRRALRSLLNAQRERPTYLTYLGRTRYWMYRDEVFAVSNGLDSQGVAKELRTRLGKGTSNAASEGNTR